MLILSSLWALSFTSSAQFLIVAPLLPSIAEQWGVADGDLGSLVSAFAWSVAVFSLLGGPLSDRYGRRAILLGGAIALAIPLLATGFAWDFMSLYIARGLTGIGAGLLSGATVAYVGDYFPREQQGLANGVVATGFAGGQVIGIPAGILLAGLDFRFPFVAFGVLVLVTAVLMFFALPEPDVELDRRFSVRETISTYVSLLTSRATRFTSVAFFFMFSGISLFIVYLPMELETSFGFSQMGVASLFLVGGFAGMFMGPFAGALSDRVGRKVLVVGGGLAAAVLMVATPWVVFDWWMAYPMFFLVIAALSLRAPPFQALVSYLVPARRRGRLLSLCFAVGRLGFGLGASASGLLYVRFGFSTLAMVGGGLSLVMALIVAFLVPEIRDEFPEDATMSRQPVTD
ncbi:MAG: putative MFS family arabinose efflux permease [Kiritimatiellia bacterium]